MRNKKKTLLLMGLCLLLISCRSVKNVDEEENVYPSISDLNGASSGYSLGNIYIGSKGYLLSLKNLSDNDILVEDQRTNRNPNMRIYDSYAINDATIRKEILEAICKYEEDDPSEWERSIDSMENEWYLHNVAYYFSLQKKRAKDVDLDNDAEYKFKASLNKVIK